MAAQMKDSSTQKKKSKSSFFLSCFGYSREAYEKKQKVSRGTQWFSWVAKKQSTKRADLLDVIGKEIQLTKPSKKRFTTRTLLSNHGRVVQTPAPVSDQVVYKTNKKRSDSAPEIVTAERKSVSKSVEISTSQKGLKAASKTTVQPQSASSPPRPRRQKAEVNADGDNINKSSSTNGKVDSMLGMSVVMVTLMIMLIWGKVCAILCTSAWFYFFPRFASTKNYQVNEESNQARELIDTNSEEYKKKVVLEGFLQRNNHRRNTATIM